MPDSATEYVNSLVVGRSSLFTVTGKHHHFCLLLADCETSARSSANSRSSKVEKVVNLMAHGGPMLLMCNCLCHSVHRSMVLRIVKAKHGEFFKSKILVCVQPLITRLCPFHVHKHRFIIHNRFITINRWSVVHYNISLQRTSLQRYIVAIYRFALRDIIAMKSR